LQVFVQHRENALRRDAAWERDHNVDVESGDDNLDFALVHSVARQEGILPVDNRAGGVNSVAQVRSYPSGLENPRDPADGIFQLFQTRMGLG